MRERIDVSEIEAQTKIRAKYLRALENEEWDLLPGTTFVKSFLRTYAQALGLDAKALVDEYKLSYELAGESAEHVPQPPVGGGRRPRPRVRRGIAQPRSQGTGESRFPRGYAIAVSGVAIVIVLLLIGLLSGGGGGGGSTTGTSASRGGGHSRGVSSGGASAGRRHAPATVRSQLASIHFEPTAEVYVCLIGDDDARRVPGVILKPGQPEPTYHAHRFLLTLGNAHLALTVNGKPLTVPQSRTAIGYAITRTGVRELTPTEEPTCT
jgi:cytoskeleton protein RodZ